MKLEPFFDKLHSFVTSKTILQLFTAFMRVLLGIGFFYPSIPKIMNRPFTMLPDSNPVGHYFNALYQTGFYYQFLGWSQLIAAILLLIPRTSHLGAILFFPIILNITVLTNSVGFKGTWLITILMLLASTYLVCWDYDRWKSILFGNRKSRTTVYRLQLVWLPLLIAGGGTAFFGSLAYVLGENRGAAQYRLLGFLFFAGLIFGLGVAVHHRFMKVGEVG